MSERYEEPTWCKWCGEDLPLRKLGTPTRPPQYCNKHCQQAMARDRRKERQGVMK